MQRKPPRCLSAHAGLPLIATLDTMADLVPTVEVCAMTPCFEDLYTIPGTDSQLVFRGAMHNGRWVHGVLLSLDGSQYAQVIDGAALFVEPTSAQDKWGTGSERGLVSKPELITPVERVEWIRQFQGVCLSSDAYIPFRDNIDRASRSNVGYIAQAGSSHRDDEVIRSANGYGMVMVHTGLRCFLH